MEFNWINYSSEFTSLIDSWMDEEARKFTGCDEGFDEYYKYWLLEPETKIGENFWAKIIIENDTPIGVIAVSLWDEVFTVSEFIIDPLKRYSGLGTRVLFELLFNGKEILGTDINVANAVIFPNNIASQKAFEKAGFVFLNAHPDGDAWYYQYIKKEV